MAQTVSTSSQPEPARAAAAAPLARLLALSTEAAALIGHFDHVTRLPNRLQFLDDFSRLAARGDETPLLVMVTLAEARHYNEVLRALGHAFAEDFVRAGAEKLSALLPAGTPVYHVSVLSLAFVVGHKPGSPLPALVGEIVRSFSGALAVNRIPIKTRVGVGLMELGSASEASEVLRATLAAAQDSRRGEDGWAWYNHKTDAAHQRAFRILADLPLALASDGQLSLHYQPRIDLKSDRCVGAEALLRWRHPDLGAISPAEFIPLAEQTALIGPLTDWVLDHALDKAGSLDRAGRPLRVSINASPVNLSEPGFAEKLLRLCDERQLAAEHVEIEFTEGTLAGNLDRTRAQLAQIRAAGVEVAIDDFGSGFANLNYLTTIPADVLKIDQSFVRPLGSGAGTEFLVRQIVEMARGLKFRVCAEGIENVEALGLLRDLGCDEGQGYYLARPMPDEALAPWLAARS